ncbi:hypothetical protein K449DRAFT_381870 [Hypoxylon sp. EC38]|nr:hypothetical protein K449DRAFT_381870 [Hypoxylon sp. EC38]
MIRALRGVSPGIGPNRLTTQIKAVLPESMAPEKKTVEEICQHLDDQDQPVTQTRTRDDNFNTRIRAAFEMFRDAERGYLLDLDENMMRSIGSDLGFPNPPRLHVASQLRHYFEVLLTLKGKKPCTLITMHFPQGSVMMNGMVLQCLSPMIQQFELESYGFTLRYLAHDVLTEQRRHLGFKGGWIFADKHSEHWNKVLDIFLLPHPGRRNPEDNIGAALGYPLPGGNATILFIDDTETSELERITGEKLPASVIGMEFFCTEGGFSRLLGYYLQCKQAAADVGVRLQIDTEEHPSFEMFLEHARSRVEI